MYQQHFNFTEPPFSISPDPRFLYMSERHREALAHLVYGAGENGGFVLLTGQVGTGKTTLIRSLFQQSIEDVDFALCLYSGFSEIEFLSLILDELGAPYPENSNRKELVYALNQHALDVHAAGRKIVIIIDEAQNLSRDLLEQIRLLTNLETNTQKLLRIILVGQEELQDILADNSLRQLSQRITTRYHLTALNSSEVDAYIAYRLQVAGGSPNIIPNKVRRRVYQLSKGTPRLVNVICERALLGAYADDRDKLSVRDVELAAERTLAPPSRKSYFRQQNTKPRSARWHLGYFLCALAIVTMSVLFLRADVSKRFFASLFSPPTQLVEILPSSNHGTLVSDNQQSPEAELQLRKAAALNELQAEQLSNRPDNQEKKAQVTELYVTDDDNKSDELADGVVPSYESTINENKQERETDVIKGLDADTQLVDKKIVNSEPVISEGATGLALDKTSELSSLKKNVKNYSLSDDQTASAPYSSLSEVYASTSTRSLLAQKLASLWGKDNALSLDSSYCEALKVERITCVTRQANLRLLAKIDRPALLQLAPSANATPFWVLLKHMDNNSAHISTNDEDFTVDYNELAGDTTGQVFFLLRQPNTKFEVKPGETDNQAGWLRERLQLYRNEPIILATRPLKYDEALKQQVKRFQQDYRLDQDGIVGEETLLYLYNLVATGETPTLKIK